MKSAMQVLAAFIIGLLQIKNLNVLGKSMNWEKSDDVLVLKVEELI